MSEEVEESAAHAGVFVTHVRSARLHAHGEASHTEHGLNFLVDGWFEMEHGTPIRAEAGSVTLMPAGVPHRPLDGRKLEYWLVGFCAACVGLDEGQALMAAFRRVRRGALPVVPLSPPEGRRLLGLVQELRAECARGAPESAELVRSLLALILGCVLRAMPAPSAPTGPTVEGAQAATGSLVAEALEYVQRECLSPISLKDVAGAVHRTPSHVAASVKNATGYSVGEWITSGRVTEAASRLAHTDDSLDAIANHVGWQDKTHFIRQFRKAFGATPAAWRRERRADHLRDAAD